VDLTKKISIAYPLADLVGKALLISFSFIGSKRKRGYLGGKLMQTICLFVFFWLYLYNYWLGVKIIMIFFNFFFGIIYMASFNNYLTDIAPSMLAGPINSCNLITGIIISFIFPNLLVFKEKYPWYFLGMFIVSIVTLVVDYFVMFETFGMSKE
jgi:hypothetical protein